MRMGGQLQLHRNERHFQGFELCCGIAHECKAKDLNAEFFVLATPSVTVSLGAKPAQAEGECLIVHRLDTVALLHTCFPSLQTCQTHLTILPTHSHWLKVCQKTELHLTWKRSVGERRHQWKRSRTPRPCTTLRLQQQQRLQQISEQTWSPRQTSQHCSSS